MYECRDPTTRKDPPAWNIPSVALRAQPNPSIPLAVSHKDRYSRSLSGIITHFAFFVHNPGLADWPLGLRVGDPSGAMKTMRTADLLVNGMSVVQYAARPRPRVRLEAYFG